MAYSVKLAPAAERQLKRLQKPTQDRIFKRLLTLEFNPRPHGVKKLKGEPNLYRIRDGDYRIVYQVKDKALIVLVVNIGDRKDIYR